MSNLITYALLFTTVNGQPMLQAESYKVSRDSMAIRVDTLALGLAGMSFGSPFVAIEIMAAVPAAGFEYDAGLAILTLVPAKVYVQGPGGNTLKGQVFITKDDLSQSVNSKAAYSFSCIGPMQQWSAASGV